MTIIGTSFLAQTTSQANRLKDLGSQLADLERQIASGKKYDTLAGFGGAGAQSVQRVRIDRNAIKAYQDNITTVNNRIQQMNQAMTSATTAAQQVVTSITSALQTSSDDVPNIATQAKNALSFVEDLANLNIDGRYLFAGSDTTSAPVVDDTQLNSNMQSQVTNWLNGTNTTAQLESNVNGFSSTQLGMNAALSASGNVTTRIDQSTSIDYTVKADSGGFQKIIQALGLMANLSVPNSSTDVPTTAQLNDIMNQVSSLLRTGIGQLQAAQTDLGTKTALIGSIQDTHTQDSATLDGLVSTAEGADTTDVVTKIQSLQTQLQASYDVTSTLSKLSLVNFL